MVSPKHKIVFQWLKYLFLSLVLLIVILIAAVNLPPVHAFLTFQTNKILKSNGIPLQIGKITLLLNGKIGVNQLALIAPENDTVFYAGKASIDLSPLPLLSKKVVINSVILYDAVANILTDSVTGDLQLLSLFTPGDTVDSKGEEINSPTTGTPWEIEVHKVNLSNIRFFYGDTLGGIVVKQNFSRALISFNNFSILKKQIDVGKVDIAHPEGFVTLWNTTDEPDNLESTALPWQFSVQNFNVDDLVFTLDQPDAGQRMDVTLKSGKVSFDKLDLAKSEIIVSEIKLNEPMITYSTFEVETVNDLKNSQSGVFEIPVLPWTITARKATIANGSFTIQTADAQLQATLDEWLPISEFDASFSKISASPDGYLLNLEKLSFLLTDRLNMESGSLFLQTDAAQNITLNLKLLALLENSKSWFKKNTELHFSAVVEGDSDKMLIQKIALESSNGLRFNANGTLLNPLKMPDSGCDLRISAGPFSRNQLLPVISHFSPGTKLPYFEPVTFTGSVKNRVMAPLFDLLVKSKSGDIETTGRVDFQKMEGELQTKFTNIQLARMFDETLPEHLTGNMTVNGRLYKGKIEDGQLFVQVDSVRYKNKTTQNISIKANVADQKAHLLLLAADSAASIDLQGFLAWDKTTYTGSVNGNIAIDFKGLNFSTEPLTGKVKLESNFSYSPDELITVANISDLTIANKNDNAHLKQIKFSLNSTKNEMQSELDAGFIHVGFESHCPLADFSNAFDSTKFENLINLDSTNFINLSAIQNLGYFKVEARVQHDSLFHLFYPDSMLSFSEVSMNIRKDGVNSVMHGTIKTELISFNKVVIHNPDVQLLIESDRLKFIGKSDSLLIPGISFGKSGIDAEILPANISANLRLADQNDSTIHQIGFVAERQNEQVIVKTPLPFWTYNGNRWYFNQADFLKWEEESQTLEASLDLRFDKNHIVLKGNNKGILELDLKNIELANLVIPGFKEYLPGGILDANLKYKKTDQHHVDLTLQMNNLKWQSVQLGLLTVNGNLSADSTGIIDSNFDFMADDSLTLHAGIISNKANKTFTIKSNFSNLKFGLFEPFISEYANQLQGTTHGEITLGSNNNNIELNGEIRFSKFGFKIIPLKTRLTIPDNKIAIIDNKLLFDNFTVTDSLNRPLTVNGKIAFINSDNIIADLKVNSDKIMVMNTNETENSSFFGSVIINSGLSVSGPVFSPEIKGNIELESGTNLIYQMIQDLSVEGTQRDVVFAAITDSLEIIYPKTDDNNKTTKMPLIETTISINPKSVFNVKIADTYNVDITVRGEGVLNYNMLPNNTMSLNGIYQISNGDCKLKITGWPLKDFKITPGSFLQWDGSVENPNLGLEATTRVKGSYFNPIDNKSRAVDFIVYMQLENKLSALEIAFGIQSSDQYITSVLSTFSKDEIMRQAVNLLLFETINLPGIESSGDYLASQINSFWESQLNSLTSTTFKKTALSFGIDSYSQSTEAGQQERTSFTYELERKFLNERATVKLSGKLNEYNESAYQTNSIFENFIFEYALDSLNTKNLKLYQKRDYEDMLEGEVIKYGAGFLYRKSYNRFKDIWRSDRKGKKGEKKLMQNAGTKQ